MTTVFVYEHVSALGAGGGSEPPPAPSLLAEGRAMLDAVAADFAAVPDVMVTTLPTADEGDFRRLAANADFTLVIAPESDGILEERCRWVEEAGGRLLGPSPAAVRLTADKLALAERFAQAGVPTPRTWALGAEPAGLTPAIWKPRDGAGSQSTFFVRSPADGRRAAEELALCRPRPAMIAQEFIAGCAASVAFLCGPREQVALSPCRQLLSDDDRFRYLGGASPLDPELADRATILGLLAVRAVQGLAGYVGIDLVLGDHPAGDRVIEINPRLTTSYVGLRRRARFSLAAMMLRAARGEPLPPLNWDPAPVTFSAGGTTFATPLA
jgi:predicted ATP-grasp superfamily ATP-dependent carboligase